MGLISKPAIVVPNHMLEQFSREWLQAYPKARILAASTDDLSKPGPATLTKRRPALRLPMLRAVTHAVADGTTSTGRPRIEGSAPHGT